MAEDQMLEQWARWLGVSDPKVVKKSLELRRLLDIKSKADISANNKTVICLDIAANLMSAHFDLEEALKRIKFRHNEYVRQRRTVEKILNLTKTPTISDLCIQLDLNKTVQAMADKLYETYRKSQFENQADFSHPQYAAMAIYQCCKVLKTKVSRANLLRLSTLRGVQWTQLEKDWTKWMETSNVIASITNTHGKRVVPTSAADEATPIVPANQNASTKKEVVVESYEDWQDRILKKAYAELKILQNES